MSQPHEELVAWQRADDLCLSIHRLTRERLPRDERFELASQLRRAAYSVAANIVEGYAFESPATRLRYLRIAVGSLAEVGYGIHLASRLGYLSTSQLTEAESEVRRTAAPLHGLVAYWKKEVHSHKKE
jgi:four helix bundle protein